MRSALGLAWSYAVGAGGGNQEGTPLMWNNRPKICCGIVNRGLALYSGLIIAPVIDGRLQALDARTGKPVWESRTAYPQDLYTLTMAPRIAGGKVIIGASGGDKPTRGFFAAFDAVTGHRAWLQNFVVSHAGQAAEEFTRSLHATVQAFATGTPQFDDITVLALRYAVAKP